MKSVRICSTFILIMLILVLLSVGMLPIGCGGGGGSSASAPAPAPAPAPTPVQSCSQLVPNVSTVPPSQTIATSAINVVPITVDGGPLRDYPNAPFVTVTVCAPGSNSNCTTIDHVLVDTGSSGLRVLSTYLPSSFTPTNVAECIQFGDFSYVWGSVETADVYLGGLTGKGALGLPIHALYNSTSSSFHPPPSACSSGFTEEDDLQSLGAKGILGVGSSQYDCSFGGINYCTPSAATLPPVAYYIWNSSSWQPTAISLANQVQNPVALFSTDNNGVIIELPYVSGPTASLNGSMVFGISTKSNNGLGSATPFYLDQNGNMAVTTTFNNNSYFSYIDSGSNGNFFPDAAITACTGEFAGWYCPASSTLVNIITTNTDGAGHNKNVSFSVGNAADMFNSCESDYVLNTLAGSLYGYFNWGLPFFYGRNVYTSITPNGDGAFWAY